MQFLGKYDHVSGYLAFELDSIFFFNSRYYVENLPWCALIVQSYALFLQYLWHFSLIALYFVQSWDKACTLLWTHQKTINKSFFFFFKDKRLFF